MIQWLENFKAQFFEYPNEIQETVTKVEDALHMYKHKIGSAMVGVKIQKAINAKRADGSVLEYGLNWQLEGFIRKVCKIIIYHLQINEGIPKDTRQVDQYLEDLSKSNGLLIQWLENFKAQFFEYPNEIQETVTKVEDALHMYKHKIGAAMVGVKIQKAIEARHADGSVLEYGLNWQLDGFIRKVIT